MRRHVIPAVALAAFLTSGCFEFFNKTKVADPTDVTVTLLGGTWTTSSSTAGSIAASCTNFTWQVSEQTGNSASGTFGATCFDDLTITGTASGTLDGNTLTWNAQATMAAPGFPNCNVQLAGTATLAGDTISIPYAGSTCLGPVSGTEILKKML
jgi:hypothetical protein